MAPIFSTTNIAADHNQLVMETMQKVALRHNLVCLLHEKPFAGVNGSGKHNNWSLSTDDGQNLLEPGRTPAENEQFLIFVSAMIMAVDRHAAKLRASCGIPGTISGWARMRRRRPSSLFLWEMNSRRSWKGSLMARRLRIAGSISSRWEWILAPTSEKITRTATVLRPCVHREQVRIPHVGSSASISGPNIVINVIAAEALDEIATRLEKAGKSGLHKEAAAIVRDAMKNTGGSFSTGTTTPTSGSWKPRSAGLPNVKRALRRSLRWRRLKP